MNTVEEISPNKIRSFTLLTLSYQTVTFRIDDKLIEVFAI